MGKLHERIDDRLRSFIEAQPVFFTATAPLSGDGHVNLSPKGRAGTLVVIDEERLAYLDFGGSGAETIAHVRENGRITLMWCAFSGPPNIVRIHGDGEAVFRDDPRWAELIGLFADADGPGARAIILVRARRIADVCGYAVPLMEYQASARSTRSSWAARRTRSSPRTARRRTSSRRVSTACLRCPCPFRRVRSDMCCVPFSSPAH